ncbi:MAG: hypothetical protein R2932_13535 [Caldilineaceae bacterium]
MSGIPVYQLPQLHFALFTRWRRLGNQPARGERWLRGSYAFFYAFLLPFICWGNIDNPHHPHQGAHFVFADPPGKHQPEIYHIFVDSGIGAGRRITVEHEPCLHPLGAHPTAATLAPNADHDLPAGQSVPAATLAQLLMLVLWAVVELRCNLAPTLAVRKSSASYRSHRPRVPTPPPRGLPTQNFILYAL